MPRLPLTLWLAMAGVLVVLLASVGGTTYMVLRRMSRARIRAWSGRHVLTGVIAAVLPWLVIAFVPINIAVNVHSLGPLLGWLLLALLVFAVTVLGPLAAVFVVVVWLRANHRRLFGPR